MSEQDKVLKCMKTYGNTIQTEDKTVGGLENMTNKQNEMQLRTDLQAF